MNKRAQLLDRPFIFIFAVIVSAFIFIFGFYLAKNLIKANTCAQLGLSVNDLRNEAERYYNFDIGSNTEFNFKIPEKIRYVCFVSKENYVDKNTFDKIDKNLYSIAENIDYNVLFWPLNYCSKSFFKIDKVNFRDNPLCVLNNGNIKLNLENKGEFVEISKA